jgi:predicted permease
VSPLQSHLTATFESIVRDVRYAWRLLWKTRAFSLTTVVTLGLTIGVTAAAFSVVDAVLLAPLPYPQPEHLHLVSRSVGPAGSASADQAVDGRTWELVRDSAAGMRSAVYSSWTTGANLVVPGGGTGSVRYVQQQRVGAGFFGVLGVSPLVGRELSADEDRPGGPTAVVLSAALWRSAFGADPAVLSRPVTLRGEDFTVVGVMPDGFATGERADLWTPLRPTTTGEGGGENYHVLVRLNNEGAKAGALAAIARVGRDLRRERPAANDVEVTFSLTPLQQGLTEGLRRPLLMLLTAVGIVLLAACVNLAGLVLARVSSRTREIATRAALGSSRAGIVRQILIEALAMTVVGGLAGIGISALALDAFTWLVKDAYEIWQPLSIGARSIAVITMLSLLAALVLGLGPGLVAARLPVLAGLSAGGGRSIAGSSTRWPRRLLVVAQVALCAILLVACGLLVRTFAHLRNLDPGFDPEDMFTASVSLQDARYRTAQSIARLFDDTLTRLQSTPGIDDAAAALGLPYERILNLGFRFADGRASDPATMTSATYVTPTFFNTMRIPVRHGRTFDARDVASSPQVAVVNSAFARAYASGEELVGRRIRLSGVEREIVGVVGDVQLKPGWGDHGPLSTMPLTYIPVTQVSDGFVRLVHGWFLPTFVVRTSFPEAQASRGIREAIATADALLPVASLRSMSEVQATSLAQQRLLMILLAGLAGAAVIVAIIGIHGLIAASVTERTREMGVRLALGATVGQAMRTLAVPGVALAAIGTAAGLVAALGLVRLLRHFVWGVSVTDPLTFGGVAILILVASAVASAVPALRLLRLDPAVTLRHE